MLDMGFIPDVERIVSMLPAIRQTLFFSATMAPEIRRLADAFLSNPKEISVSPPASVAATIVAGLVWVRETDKREALRRILRREEVQNALIFCNRKVEVDVLYKSLRRHGFSVGALHGDMDQPSRFATLEPVQGGRAASCSSARTWRRAASTSAGCRTCSTSTCRSTPRTTCTASAAPGAPGREGHAFTIATPDDARSVAAIETLTGRPIPRIEIDGLDPVSAEELAEGRGAPAARPRAVAAPAPEASRSAGGRGRGSRAGHPSGKRRRRAGARRPERRAAARAAGEASAPSARPGTPERRRGAARAGRASTLRRRRRSARRGGAAARPRRQPAPSAPRRAASGVPRTRRRAAAAAARRARRSRAGGAGLRRRGAGLHADPDPAAAPRGRDRADPADTEQEAA